MHRKKVSNHFHTSMATNVWKEGIPSFPHIYGKKLIERRYEIKSTHPLIDSFKNFIGSKSTSFVFKSNRVIYGVYVHWPADISKFS